MLGRTSAGGLPANRNPFGTLLPDFFQVDRDSVALIRDAVAYCGPERIAPIMAEPVIGAGGVFPPPPGYLAGLRELCDECGALLVFDEVITGFGLLRGRGGQRGADAGRGPALARGRCQRPVASGFGWVGWASGCCGGPWRGADAGHRAGAALEPGGVHRGSAGARGDRARTGLANSVAFSPPLIISDEEVDELVAETAAVLDELSA